MTRESSSPPVQPYWDYAPQFLLYPLKPPLNWLWPLLVGISVAGGMLDLGILGMLLSLSGVLLAAEFGLQICSHTAEGNLEPPGPDFGELFDEEEIDSLLLFTVIIVLVVIGPALFVLFVPASVQLALKIAACALFPCIIMLLATSDSLDDVFDPAAIAGLIRCMGAHYLVLWLMIFTGAAVYELLPGIIPSSGAKSIDTAIRAGIQIYVVFVAFHVMGYFLLEFETAGDARMEAMSSTPIAQPSSNSELAQELIDKGKYLAATQALREDADAAPESVGLNGWLLETACAGGDQQAAVEAADRLIGLHVNAGRYHDAAAVAEEVIALDSGYQPRDESTHLPVVRALRQRGMPRLAVGIANGFHKRFPGSDDIPELYDLVAQIFETDLRRPQKSQAIREYLRSNYPEHPVAL